MLKHEKEPQLNFEIPTELFESMFLILTKKVAYKPPKIYTSANLDEIKQNFSKYPRLLESLLNKVRIGGVFEENGCIKGLNCHSVQTYGKPENLGIEDIFWLYNFLADNSKEKRVEICLRRFVIAVYLHQLIGFLQSYNEDIQKIKTVPLTTNTHVMTYLADYLGLAKNLDFHLATLKYGKPNKSDEEELLFESRFPVEKLLNPKILESIKLKSEMELNKAFKYFIEISQNSFEGEQKILNFRKYLQNYFQKAVKS